MATLGTPDPGVAHAILEKGKRHSKYAVTDISDTDTLVGGGTNNDGLPQQPLQVAFESDAVTDIVAVTVAISTTNDATGQPFATYTFNTAGVTAFVGDLHVWSRD